MQGPSILDTRQLSHYFLLTKHKNRKFWHHSKVTQTENYCNKQTSWFFWRDKENEKEDEYIECISESILLIHLQIGSKVSLFRQPRVYKYKITFHWTNQYLHWTVSIKRPLLVNCLGCKAIINVVCICQFIVQIV